MEYWYLRMFLNFKFIAKVIFKMKPSHHFPKTHYSNAPPFH
jgi:hypothetical protein